MKGLLKRVDKHQREGTDLPEYLKDLVTSFGPGGASSGSRRRPVGVKEEHNTSAILHGCAEKRSKAAAERRPIELKERKGRTKEEQRKDENILVLIPGRQRGLRLEREAKRQSEEYYRQKAARRAEAAKKERESKEAAREAEVEKTEEKEEGKKKEEPKPWILKALEKAEAAVEAEEYSYYSYTPKEEETEEEDKEEDPSGELGTPHFF